MSKTVTLHCKLGDHKWERPSKRGRIPENCPEHTPKSVQKKTQSVDLKQEGRARKAQENRRISIASIIAHPKAQSCQCPITPDSTNDELTKMKGCTDPFFVCATLDAVRRAVNA